MGRDTARLVAETPVMEHGVTKRTFGGSVTMSSVTSTTVSVSNTGSPTTVFSTTFDQPLAWSSASVSGTTMNLTGTNTPFTLTLTVNGSTITQTTKSATASFSSGRTQHSHSYPLGDGQWGLKAAVAGGTGTFTVTISRDSRWTVTSPANP